MKDQLSTREAIRSLYELYSNDIYRYARITLDDSSEAYDVVQEVFLRAYRSWNSYRQQAYAKTWLMSIARYYMIDLHRKHQAQAKNLSASELTDDVADRSPSMYLIPIVQDGLQQLKVEYREAIILRFMENLSVAETAAVLGWSEKKVRNATHRGLQKLREVLREVNGQDEI